MIAKFIRLAAAMFLAMSFFVFAGQAYAGADDLAKKIETIIRNAERKMFSGNNTEADALLNEAAALIAQGKAEEPNNQKVLQAEKNFSKVRTNVDKKLGSPDNKPSSSGQELPNKSQPKTLSSKSPQAAESKISDGGKLPGGVKKRLQDITVHLNNAERYTGKDAKNAKYKLQQAAEIFDEIEKKFGGQFEPSHSDFTAVKNRFTELSKKADEQGVSEENTVAAAAGSEEAKERQAAEWIPKFREYLSYEGQEGHNPSKLVFVPGTSEPEKFSDAQKRYEAFKAFYEGYKKTDFPNGKTWELEDLAENQAPLRIKSFEGEFGSRIESVAGDAGNEIDAAMGQLEKDNGWKFDKTIKPNLVDHKWMTSIQEATQKVIVALGEGDPKRKEIQEKFDALVAKDRENRQIRKERTFMTPDRYAGDDIEELKKKAESLVKNDKAEGGDPIRSTIISENWQEQTFDEWTDTTQTTLRKRTTRSVTGQVAAKTSDGGVLLITVALAKDKQIDGSWSELYGNLHQYADPMLEANVKK